MTRIETYLPIPEIEEKSIDLSDLVQKEQAGEFNEPVKKIKKVREKKEPKREPSMKVDKVPSFELIEDKELEKVVRMMYEGEAAEVLEMSLQSVHTPFRLCYEILEKMDIDPTKKFLVVTAVEFIVVLIDIYKVPKENIFFLDEGQKDGTIDSIKAVVLEKIGFEQHQILSMDGAIKMKFDYIVGNPPYQEKKDGNFKANSTLWQSIILHVVEQATKPETVMSMIHPAGWRKGSGKYKKIREIYDSWDVIYLNINNMATGEEVFSVSTRFDWCVAINRPYQGNTKINDEQGLETDIDLSMFEIIPNEFSCDFNKWIGSSEKCNFGYSASWYHCQRKNMSSVKDDQFKYPCIRNVGEDDLPSKLWYSNEDKGMFGIPKIVFGRFGYGLFIDKTGEFGCTEDCAYIAAAPEELERIYEVLKSEEFLRIAESTRVGGSRTIYETAFMKQLRKDFWK